jgi:hypothetical protein
MKNIEALRSPLSLTSFEQLSVNRMVLAKESRNDYDSLLPFVVNGNNRRIHSRIHNRYAETSG